MSLDIDSFLENEMNLKENKKNYDNNLENNKNSIIKNNNLNLDFENVIFNDLNNLKQKSNFLDLYSLNMLYQKVKSLDSSLLTKFSNIQSIHSNMLNIVSSNFSKKYLDMSKLKINNLTSKLELELNLLNKELEKNNFDSVYEKLKKLNSYYSLIPEDFLEIKKNYFLKIKEVEILFNKKILEYGDNDFKNIKFNLKKISLTLESSLNNKDINLVSNLLKELDKLIDLVPKYFLYNLGSERINLLNLIKRANIFLNEQYLNDFNLKVEMINSLIEKFHNNYINSNLDGAILVYEEIVFLFNKLPKVNLEKRLKLNSQILNLHSNLNKLVMNIQISSMVEGFNNAKILEQAKEYLKSCKRKKQVNLDNLRLLKNKLLKVSDRYKLERNALLRIINYFLLKSNEDVNFLKDEKILLVDKKENNLNLNSIKVLDQNNNNNNNNKIIENQISLKTKKSNSNLKKVERKEIFSVKKKSKINSKNLDKKLLNKENNYDLNDKQFNTNKIKYNSIELKNLTNYKIKIDKLFSNRLFNLDKGNKLVLKEIKNYLSFILDSNDSNEIRLAYEKIKFYLNLLKISNQLKLELKSKIDFIVMRKLK